MGNNIAYSMILEFYGIENQKQKFIEECAELIRAIARDDEFNFIEEMADVLVLIEQFKTIPGFEDKIEGIKSAKIKRTLDRIQEQRKIPKNI